MTTSERMKLLWEDIVKLCPHIYVEDKIYSTNNQESKA